MDIAITRMSSKGQIVIPTKMREGIKEGEKLLLIKDGKQLIMKKANKLDENFKEDIEFARRTEEAWQRYKKGKFVTREADEFLKELEKW